MGIRARAWETLDAADPPDAAALQDLRERGIAATRQLAKRQVTWLRGMPHRTVIACDALYALPSAARPLPPTPPSLYHFCRYRRISSR